MLKIFSGLTSCLKLMPFLEITLLSKVISLLKVIVFLSEVACFVEKTYFKGAGTEDASIEGIDTSNLYIKTTYIRAAFDNAYIDNE